MNGQEPLGGSAPDPVLPPPSRESLREVKAEAKERNKARRAGYDSVYEYRTRPRRSRKLPLVLVSGAIIAAVAFGAWFLVTDGGSAPTASIPDEGSGDPTAEVEAAARVQMAEGPWKSWKPGMSGIKVQDLKAYSSPDAEINRAGVAAAVAEALSYMREAMFNPAVLYDGDVQPVLRSLGDDASALKKAWESTKPFVAQESAYMTRFRPGWVSGTAVAPRSTGSVTYGVRTEIADGQVSAAFIVRFKARVAYPVVVGENQDAVEVVVVARNGELVYVEDEFPRPFFGTGGWTSSAGRCGIAQSISSDWVAGLPADLLPPGKDHCFA